MSRFLLALVFLGLVGFGYYRWQAGHPEAANSSAASTPTTVPGAKPTSLPASAAKRTVLTGYVGASKMALLETNEQIRQILLERYGLEIHPIKKGGVEMVTTEPLDGIDFIWPASQVEVDIYEQAGKPKVSTETFFASPMVFYTWNKVLDGLVAKGIAYQEQGVYYVKTREMFNAIVAKKPWAELGLTLSGSIKVSFSDPLKANSGLQYLILAGTALSDAEVLEDVAKVLPPLKQMVRQQGLMTASTGDIFRNYLQQGVGSMPIVAGYENQLVEFFIAHPEAAASIRESLRIVYPHPTLWSTHPIIAVTERGKALIRALQDKDIQDQAWRIHGLRTLQASADVSKVNLGSTLPPVVTNAINNPSSAVIRDLKAGL